MVIRYFRTYRLIFFMTLSLPIHTHIPIYYFFSVPTTYNCFYMDVTFLRFCPKERLNRLHFLMGSSKVTGEYIGPEIMLRPVRKIHFATVCCLAIVTKIPLICKTVYALPPGLQSLIPLWPEFQAYSLRSYSHATKALCICFFK